MAKSKERAVLVTTEFRGVFFGYASDTSGDVVKLRAGRNVVYWPTEQRGFVGLASRGPLKGARVGPAADMELRKVTAIVEVTDEAVKRFEEFPWS